MYHNPHVKSTSRSNDYTIKGEVESGEQDSPLLSGGSSRPPQYDPGIMSTPPLPSSSSSRNQYDTVSLSSISTQPQHSPSIQYNPPPPTPLQPPVPISSASASIQLSTNHRQQQQYGELISPPIPVSSRILHDKSLTSSRPPYRPAVVKHRPRPVSVHEPDFLKTHMLLPVKSGDTLEKSFNGRRSNPRPLSLHEQQQPSAHFEQASPQYQRAYNIGHISKPSSITGVHSLSSQSQDEKIISKLKQDHSLLPKKIETHKRLAMDDRNGAPLVMERVRDRGGLSKDYDYLKNQCEQAMRDIQDLKQQQVETAHKHDNAVKECEVLRNNYKATEDKSNALKNEIKKTNLQCDELRDDKERMRREIEDLQKLREEDKLEITEMRKHQREFISESGSSEMLNMFDTTVGKYDSLKHEFDNMRRRYSENLTLLSGSESQVKLLQEQNKRLKEGKDEIGRDIYQLKKHFTTIIQQSQNEVSSLKQEISAYKSALALNNTQNKMIKDMGKFQKERDAVLHEYSLVMEERNTVYKEIEELEEKLSSSQKQLDGSVKENKSMSDHLETLKREIASALQDRDHAMKELNELKEKYSSTLEGIKQEKRIERERSSRDSSDASSKDIATARDIDSLKRELERVKAELVDTQKEVILAKNRRDWVFSERDKIVRERESIKTLSDKLRRERDSAVTQFMEAVKDSDELKSSKTEAHRQLKELQEKYDTLLEKIEKENIERLNDMDAYNRSTDSAIGDLTEWHVETRHIDLSANPGELGFNLGQGHEENSVVVTSVTPGTEAFKVLRVNDLVVKVNNVDVNMMNSKDVLEAASHSGYLVSVAVKKRKAVGGRGIKPVIIRLSDLERDAGIQIASGMYVSGINPGSPASIEGTLATGDRIISVNGASVDNLSVSDVLKRIRESETHVSLNVLKFPSSPSLLSMSPSSSGHMLSDVGSPDRSCNSPNMNLWHLPNSSDNSSKARGSQTDSLDSPPTSARAAMNSRNRDTGFLNENRGMYSKSPSLEKPSQSSKETLLNRVKKKLTKAKPSNQTNRNEKCRSVLYSPNNEIEREAIEELNGIVSQYSQPEDSNSLNNNVQPKTKSKRRLVHTMNSGGTWPRYKPAIDDIPSNIEGFQPIVPSRRTKQRPPLDEILYRHVAAPTNSLTAVGSGAAESTVLSQSSGSHHRVPPTPPERNDSFNRSASVSVKHSPQSSDSTVKSSHSQQQQQPHTAAVSSPNKFFQQNVQSLSATGGIQQKSYDVFPPSVISRQGSLPRKAGSSDVGASESPQMSSSVYDSYSGTNSGISTYNKHPAYNFGSSTDSTHTSPDLTVVSVDMSRYNRRPRTRKTMPGRHQDDYHNFSEEQIKNNQNTESMTGSSSGGSEKLGFKAPVKPSFINIEPNYPPSRPPPPPMHAGSPFSAASNNYVNPHSSIRSPLGSYSSGHTLSSNSSQGGGKPPIGYFPQSTRQHPPPPVPPHPYYTETSSPVNIGPPPLQGFSPPPAYSYNVRHNRLNTPSPSPSQQSNITYDNSGTNSEGEFPFVRGDRMMGRNNFIPGSLSENPSHLEGIATLPKRSQNNERIRIPSNHSMYSSTTQSSVSKTSSFERMSWSDRASPISPFMQGASVSVHDYPSSSASLPKSSSDHKNIRPQPGTTRSIIIEKGSDPRMGIKIETGMKGVFVSSISEHSLASKAGLCVGDQLLEVCGINMRKATKEQVATVLTQVGASITVLVQYNPDNLKPSGYQDHDSSSSSSSDSDDDDDTEPEPDGNDHVRTGSQRSNLQSHTSQKSGGSGRSGSGGSSIRRQNPPSLPQPPPPPPQALSASNEGGVSSSEVPTSMSPVHARTKGDDSVYAGQLRFVFYKKCNPEDHVGFDMIGGNAVGIFVDRVHPSGIVPSGPSGLNTGDQIIEFNGVNFRDLTFEQATVEVSKPSDSVTIRAQYNYAKYKKVENQPGDSLYVKALFDHTSEKDGELSFNRDDILYVENTMYRNSVQGVWSAWLLDETGAKVQCGTIPSKNKLEDEYALRRSISDIGEDELKGSRRGSTSANRRSFFRRKKHHRNNSKDSRELSSFSDASINSASDYDDGSMWTYERVKRLDNKVWRPVMILGPLAEALIDKITSESPDKYCRCLPQIVQTSISTIQAGQQNGVFIDFKAHADGQFECITVDSIKTIMDNNRHCLLDIEPEAIEILHKLHIYPIILFIKHDTPKQIREYRDSRFLTEKLTSKHAKELYQRFKDHEHNYKRYFADVIQGESLAQLCVKIKNNIDKEQNKTLWVPSGPL